MPAAVVIGAGPGIGASVARRFARQGFSIGAVARTQATIDATLASICEAGVTTLGLTADVADDAGLRAALDTFVERFGVPDVVVYNAAVIQWDAIGELSVEGHCDAWAVNVVGAITTASHLLPPMAEAGAGTFIITGGMPVPKPEVTSLSLGKAGVRALTDLLDAQFGSAGVHVATVTVHGPVAPGSAFDPDRIAEEYWRLHEEPVGAWTRVVDHRGAEPIRPSAPTD